MTSTLKAPALPSKPLKETFRSRLNGRAYMAAGQAGAALHTMLVLQAYQADLLKDLDQAQGLPPEAVTELRRTTDLALRATKQMAADGGDGGHRETSVDKPGGHRGERETISSRCAGFAVGLVRHIR